MRFLYIALSLALLGMTASAWTQQNPAGLELKATRKVSDVFTPLVPGEVILNGGMLGTRISRSEKNRLLKVDENDLLDAFERRDAPHQEWQGEHVGKFLHAATQAWKYTGDAALKAKLDRVVNRLLKTQEADGYLGTYPTAKRWTSWDVWVHKYDLLGLLTYYQYTGSKPALQACRRIGDLVAKTFGTGAGQLNLNEHGEHVGMAADSVLEAIVLLYRATGEPRYRQFADYIVTNYDAPSGPAVLASLEKTKSVRKVANGKAYEMLSNFNGLLELYRTTGERRLLKDMETGWEDIVKNRLYITGSASAGELFQDEFNLPNGERASICETCVTVSWEQMNLQLLRLTGESRFADQAERSIYNHLLAAQKPTGDQWAYYTPLEGHKPYGNSTNCCLSSGPRGVALIPSIAVMKSADDGLVVNLYNNATVKTRLKSGRVTLNIKTQYPANGVISITVIPEKAGAKFPIRLRIPSWAKTYMLAHNGASLQPTDTSAGAGKYIVLTRAWEPGDKVSLNLFLPTRLVQGDHGNGGKAAILRGPLVLALDSTLNPAIRNLKRAELTTDSVEQLKLIPTPEKAKAGELVYKTEGRVGGQTGVVPLFLTPFATAGQNGTSRFLVWMARRGQGNTTGSISLFTGGKMAVSRVGNVQGEINDDDFDSFSVTFNGQKADEDWFAVTLPMPVEISRVVYAHGRTFHDGGWFDSAGGAAKPRLEVQTEPGGAWKPIATFDSYPETTATDTKELKDGEMFEVKFTSVRVVAIRVIGKPATGDNPAQSFSSCAELQAFAK